METNSNCIRHSYVLVVLPVLIRARYCSGLSDGLMTLSIYTLCFQQGDGGSPLMCPAGRPEDNQYWQIGIVAWGIGCGGPIPGIYTNVAFMRQWIDEVVKFIGFDTETYTLDVTQLIDVRT